MAERNLNHLTGRDRGATTTVERRRALLARGGHDAPDLYGNKADTEDAMRMHILGASSSRGSRGVRARPAGATPTLATKGREGSSAKCGESVPTVVLRWNGK